MQVEGLLGATFSLHIASREIFLFNLFISIKQSRIV